MAQTRHGFLVVQYPQSGDKYEGEWVLGKKHGKGRYTSHNGDMYEGEYKDGKRNGVGLYTYSNGDQYEGEWKAGKKQGQGIMTFSNGAKYEGFYKEDMKAYRGRYTHADGSMYTGEYKKGKPSGRGVYEYPTGEKYEGEFAAGLKHGQGRVTLADGMCYNAKYHLGKRTSRKKVVALPWGFGEEDDDEELTAARSAAKKESQRHSTTFAFLQPDKINKHLPSSKPSTMMLEDDTDKKKHLMIEDGSTEGMKGGKRLSLEDGDDTVKGGGKLPAVDSDDELDIWEITANKNVKSKLAFDRSSVGGGPGTEDSHLVRKTGKGTLDGVLSPSWAGKAGLDDDGRDEAALKLFNAIDVDHSGTLSPAEVRSALMRFGFSNKKIAALFKIADVDHDGSISLHEFRQGLVPLLMKADELKKEVRGASSWEAIAYLDVHVHRCRNLPAVQRDGDHALALPFVQLTCNKQRKQSRTGREGEENPDLDGKFTFYLRSGEDDGTLDVIVMDWNVEGGNEAHLGGFSLPLKRLLASDTIKRQWYTLHKDGQRVENRGQASQVELAFKSESLPAVCEVYIRKCDNLPVSSEEQKVDPYVKVTVAGQMRTSQVIKESTRPEFQQTFNFNLFAEDLMSELVIAVIDWNAESKHSGKRGGLIGQLKIQMHDLLATNKSKDGWCTLLDHNNLPVSVGADGKAETRGSLAPAKESTALVPAASFARINLRVRCRLRHTAHETDSEMGRSRGAASPYQQSLLGSASGSSTEEDDASDQQTEDGDQEARRRMQEDDSFFTFIGGEQQHSSSSNTHSSSDPTTRIARTYPIPPPDSQQPSQPSSSQTHSSSDPNTRIARTHPIPPASQPNSNSSNTHSSSDPTAFIPRANPSASSRRLRASALPDSSSSRPSGSATASREPTGSGSTGSRTPATHSTDASIGSGGPGKTLSRSEEVQLNKLRKKTAKALANGDQALAEHYRREIARLLGEPFAVDVIESASASASASASHSGSHPASHSASFSGSASQAEQGSYTPSSRASGAPASLGSRAAWQPEESSLSGSSLASRGVRWDDGGGGSVSGSERMGWRGGSASESEGGGQRGLESGSRGGLESGSRGGLESGSRGGLASVVEEGSAADEEARPEEAKRGRRWNLLPKFGRKGK